MSGFDWQVHGLYVGDDVVRRSFLTLFMTWGYAYP